jgi:hypothetical protein
MYLRLFQIEEYLEPPRDSNSATGQTEDPSGKTPGVSPGLGPSRARHSVLVNRLDLKTSLSQLQTEKLPPQSSDDMIRRFTHVQPPAAEVNIPWSAVELPSARRPDKPERDSVHKNRKPDTKSALQKYLRLSGMILIFFIYYTFYQFTNISQIFLVNDLENPDMSGFLVKQGAIRMNWKRRWFVLKAHHLFYFRSRQVNFNLICC